jgi:hypothetical protein
MSFGSSFTTETDLTARDMPCRVHQVDHLSDANVSSKCQLPGALSRSFHALVHSSQLHETVPPTHTQPH